MRRVNWFAARFGRPAPGMLTFHTIELVLGDSNDRQEMRHQRRREKLPRHVRVFQTERPAFGTAERLGERMLLVLPIREERIGLGVMIFFHVEMERGVRSRQEPDFLQQALIADARGHARRLQPISKTFCWFRVIERSDRDSMHSLLRCYPRPAFMSELGIAYSRYLAVKVPENVFTDRLPKPPKNAEFSKSS
jgi:hypothetical protein